MPGTKHSFTSTRLQFDEATWNDLTQIHILQSTPEIDEYNTLGIPASIETTRKVMRPAIEDDKNSRRTVFCWMIRKKENNEFIGICGLSLIAERFKMGEIYYNLLPEFWGQGFGTEAAQSLISYCFKDIKLHRVVAGVATENKRSIKLLEKVGMTREGLCRKILPIRGEWKDNFEYAILEDDLREY